MISGVPSFWGLCGACANSRYQALSSRKSGRGSRTCDFASTNTYRINYFAIALTNTNGHADYFIYVSSSCLSLRTYKCKSSPPAGGGIHSFFLPPPPPLKNLLTALTWTAVNGGQETYYTLRRKRLETMYPRSTIRVSPRF